MLSQIVAPACTEAAAESQSGYVVLSPDTSYTADISPEELGPLIASAYGTGQTIKLDYTSSPADTPSCEAEMLLLGVKPGEERMSYDAAVPQGNKFACIQGYISREGGSFHLNQKEIGDSPRSDTYVVLSPGVEYDTVGISIEKVGMLIAQVYGTGKKIRINHKFSAANQSPCQAEMLLLSITPTPGRMLYEAVVPQGNKFARIRGYISTETGSFCLI